jgi:hypothetical protein
MSDGDCWVVDRFVPNVRSTSRDANTCDSVEYDAVFFGRHLGFCSFPFFALISFLIEHIVFEPRRKFVMGDTGQEFCSSRWC